MPWHERRKNREIAPRKLGIRRDERVYFWWSKGASLPSFFDTRFGHMVTIVRYFLLGSALGFAVAILGWLAWWLGSLVLGAALDDHLHALWPAVGVGVIAGAGAGAIAAKLSRAGLTRLEQPAPDRSSKKAKTKAKPIKKSTPRVRRNKRRHPLDRDACVARITPTFRWQLLSRALKTLLHGTGKQLRDRPIFSMIHPEDVPGLDKAFTLASQTGAVQSALCRMQKADWLIEDERDPGPVDTSVLPMFDPESLLQVRIDVWANVDQAGKVRRFDCRFYDLTPQILPRDRELITARGEVANAKKRAQTLSQDLDRLKLSYRELYQNAPVMYFSLDREGRLVTFNDTLAETLGYQRHELQNLDYSRLLATQNPRNYVAISESMPSQEGELETKWRKKDGSVIDVWLHSVPVFDDQGRFIRRRSAALDLTEKNRLSNELRVRGDELESMNQRLRVINSELEAFTHVVSHDLKEPLRTLQAYSHILAEEHGSQLGPDGFQYINHLIRASRRLGQLIDELLNLSHAGRITRPPQVFNLLEVVATVRQDLVDLIQRRQAVLSTEGSLPEVIGDSVRITQLLANLVANGIKYNRDPAPQITIGAMPCVDDPDRVTITVRDNGIGIDRAFHQQIFGIFRRLHQADEFEGTGAGLAICKKIVEGHGGRIWVESALGNGATFYFTLPRPPVHKDPAPGNGKHKIEGAAPTNLRRTTIHKPNCGADRAPQLVVVDDQSDVGLIIQKLGKRDGLAITWFPTAEDAWEHLQHERADLLLLDVNLPGMDGVELCRRVRTLAHLKDAPIAMFTPDQDVENLETLREAGADFFLTKDLLCQPTDWQDRIQELLAQIRQPAASFPEAQAFQPDGFR
jgi:PAS domain S-box-containing protein